MELALAVGRELDLDARRLQLLEFAALLHDIGKIAISKTIINKPGPLNDAEWAIVREHTVVGHAMLDRVGGLMGEVGLLVRASHERWNGTGYPDGLAGEAIPLESRIVACCDAFNAMTTRRPYREPRPTREAVRECLDHAGSQFDPVVVRALVAVIAD